MSAFDVIVIGGGPAGMAAASRAAELDLKTALVEQASQTGGQVYRPLPAAFRGNSRTEGDRLRDRIEASGATLLVEHTVWNVTPGYEVDVLGPPGGKRLRAPTLILATGTHERFVPVEGWTLPGVLGLGAATVLMKSQQLLPGRRVVVAGAGPLLLLVARMIVEAGGAVAALVDANGRTDWLSKLPSLASRPDLMWQGANWWRSIRSAGTPVFWRHRVSEIHGDEGVQSVRLVPVGAPSEPAHEITADAVCIGHGLTPANEIARLLEVTHRYRPELGGWVPDTDEEQQTSRKGVYVVGDAAGVRGAAAAPLSGELAAIAAARALEQIDDASFTNISAPLRRKLRRAARFGQAMNALTELQAEHMASIRPGTVVCRCEDITRAQIGEALAAGCREINQVKAATRCGMGPCQGRMCGEAVASLMTLHELSREQVGQLTARPPFLPVSCKALTGSFVYDDITMEEHAPT